MSRIFWDTNIFIYLMEGSGENHNLARKLLNRMFVRRDELITSAMTLGELLVKPLEGEPAGPGATLRGSSRRSAVANSVSRMAETSNFCEMMSSQNWRRKTRASSRLMNSVRTLIAKTEGSSTTVQREIRILLSADCIIRSTAGVPTAGW